MRWLVGLVGFVIAVKGGMDLGAVMGDGSVGVNTPTSASFNYAEASRAERAEWLDMVGKKLERGAKREAGRSHFVSYKETRVLANSNEVQTVLLLNNMYEFRPSSKIIQDGLKDACPVSVRLGMYANNIKWTQKIVKSNGMTVLNLPIMRSNCRKYVETS